MTAADEAVPPPAPPPPPGRSPAVSRGDAARHCATAPPPPPGRGALMDTVVDTGNMLKAFIGLNFMYVAYAFSTAGLVRGAVGLVVLVAVTEHCCLLLLEVKNAMPAAADGAGGKPPTFADIARFAGGVRMERAINVALLITQFGYCVGYLIFISQTVHDLTRTGLPVWPFIVLPLPPLLGLALLRSIRALGPWSLLANAALLAGFVAVVGYIGKHFRWQPSEPSVLTFPLFFGQMTAALEGIGLVVPVEASMANPARFPIVLRVALLVMGAVLMTVGVLGFATFGANTRSILLLNFGGSPVVSAVKGVLVIGILFTYPLQLVPVVQTVEGWLLDGGSDRPSSSSAQELSSVGETVTPSETDAWEDDSVGSDAAALPAPPAAPARRAVPSTATPALTTATLLIASRRETFVKDPRQVIGRVTIVCATAVTAMLAGASFGLFQSLVGSVGASTLAYTAPSLFHVRVFGDRLSGRQKAKDWAIFAFGVLGSVVGTLTTLWEIQKVHASGAVAPP